MKRKPKVFKVNGELKCECISSLALSPFTQLITSYSIKNDFIFSVEIEELKAD